MTIFQAAQDIRYLISDFYPTEDTRISYGYSLELANQKRAAIITADYAARGMLNEQWLSDHGIVDVTQVNMSNQLETQKCDCYVGKVTIPQIVRLDFDRFKQVDVGLHTIKSTCGIHYDRCTERKFLDMWEAFHKLRKLPYYWHIGNALYAYPFRDEMNCKLILYNPLDGKILRSEKITNGTLISGQVYIVDEGNIMYNLIVYQRGDTFTASAAIGASWTGSGVVSFNVKVRNVTWTDPYPIDGFTFTQVKKLIQKDFENGKFNLIDAVDDAAVEEGLQAGTQ